MIATDPDLLVDWRRTLHRTPEAAFAEHASTATVRAVLDGLGLREVALPTATGAAFLVEGVRTGPRVLVRADLDALPVTEHTGLAFASQVPGLMHACGHDAHVAMLLGLGHRLAADPPAAGSVLLLFQPAEEILSGARAVLAAGLLDRMEIDAVLGMHITPMLPTGRFGIRSGPLLAGAIGYRVEVRGRGGHGALGRSRGDALAAAASLVALLGALPSRMPPDRMPPDVADSPVPLPAVTVCELHAGLAPNVIPDAAELTGTLRYATGAERVWRRMEQVVAGHAAAYGVDATLHRTFAAPPVVNDPRACAAVAAALVERFTMPALRWLPGPLPTSDDFAEYLARRPGCYVLVGAARPDPATWVAHSPRFDIDEKALPGCVDALAVMVAALLERPPPAVTR